MNNFMQWFTAIILAACIHDAFATPGEDPLSPSQASQAQRPSAMATPIRFIDRPQHQPERDALGAAPVLKSVTTPQQTGTAYNYFPGKNIPFTQTSGKVVAAYIPNWAMASGYDPSLLPPNNLTHLFYAFLTICGPGQLPSDQAVCALKNNFELATDSTSADNLDHGKFLALKQSAPNLKILASIGGGGSSNPYFYLAGDATKRAVFIASVKNYLSNHLAFDGIDIDWEVPTDNWGAGGIQLGSPTDGQSYVLLLQELRSALDALGASNGRRYLLTSAVSVGNYYASQIDYRSAQQSVDYFMAMTYDYYGGWSNQVGHHTPLYPGDAGIGIQTLLNAGIAPAKLVHGVAAYSHGWGNCSNPANPIAGTGDPNYNGAGGTEIYRTLATSYFDHSGTGINGYQVVYDGGLHAYYLWNNASNTFIGYDDPRAVAEKGQFALSQGLAGVFAWEISQDNGDILSAMNFGIGNQPGADTSAPSIASLSASPSKLTAAGTMTLSANVSDSGSGVSKVEFYKVGVATPFATATASPYQARQAFTIADNGSYQYYIKAYDFALDNNGNPAPNIASNAATPTSVTVSIASAPTATIGADNTNVTVIGTTVHLNGAGGDSVGVASVAVMSGTKTLSKCYAASCQASVSFTKRAQNGTHDYKAKVCNTANVCVYSTAVSVVVKF